MNEQFLELMRKYQQTLKGSPNLASTMEILENTSVLVEIFNNDSNSVENIGDKRIEKLLKVLSFFTEWEKEFEDPKDRNKHLMSKETREDVISTIVGFVEVVKIAEKHEIAIIPGYFNSDLIENWFCQMRGLRQGMNTNMTLAQIGPSINANLLTGNMISRKKSSNVGSGVREYEGASPAPLKLKK